jgi:hypothetical protein
MERCDATWGRSTDDVGASPNGGASTIGISTLNAGAAAGGVGSKLGFFEGGVFKWSGRSFSSRARLFVTLFG